MDYSLPSEISVIPPQNIGTPPKPASLPHSGPALLCVLLFGPPLGFLSRRKLPINSQISSYHLSQGAEEPPGLLWRARCPGFTCSGRCCLPPATSGGVRSPRSLAMKLVDLAV